MPAKREDEEILEIERSLGDYFGALEVSEENLSEQMSRQAANYVYYARVAALARKRLLEKELELKRYEALRSKELRLEYAARGDKYTVQQIQDDVRCTLEWKRLNEELIERKVDLDLAESIREGFFQRKSMLEEFAKSLRREMENDPVLKMALEKYNKRRKDNVKD